MSLCNKEVCRYSHSLSPKDGMTGDYLGAGTATAKRESKRLSEFESDVVRPMTD